MNILHVYKTYYPEDYSGMPKVIGTLTRHLGGTVLALGPKDDHFQWGGAEVHICKRDFDFSQTGFSFGAFSKFRELSQKADVIHYHFPWPMADLLHFVVRPKTPAIVTYQSDIVRQKTLGYLYRPLCRWFLGQMKYIIATSPQYAATSPNLQRFQNKVKIIPNGIEPDDYPKPTTEVIRKWESTVGRDFFLFIGVLRYYKGLQFLLEACAGTNLPVVIAGTGEEETELKQLSKKLRLTNVTFVGHVSEEDKMALLSLCKAFVFPSHLRSEAFGISLLEAAMMGKPMICCSIGTGTTYINVNQETGFAVPPADPAAIRDAMQKLAMDSSKCTAMGISAKKHFNNLFLAKKMANEYKKVYESIRLNKA